MATAIEQQVVTLNAKRAEAAFAALPKQGRIHGMDGKKEEPRRSAVPAVVVVLVGETGGGGGRWL